MKEFEITLISDETFEGEAQSLTQCVEMLSEMFAEFDLNIDDVWQFEFDSAVIARVRWTGILTALLTS